MKYFTPRLWLGLNRTRSRISLADWNRVIANYKRQRQPLVRALPARAKEFFTRVSLHDGTLIRFECGDLLRTKRLQKVCVRADVLDFAKQYIFSLKYDRVSRIQLDFPGQNVLFPYGLRPNFGDWGYDELTKAPIGLRHEILFSSGATILIEFGGFTYTRRRAKR